MTGVLFLLLSFAAFKLLSGLAGGTMDGVPTDLLNAWPTLKAFHNRVAELPAIAQYYAHITEGPRLSYKPLP
jgi:hypothetical protein